MENYLKLKDKVVLITGSSKGIGKEIALLFAKNGAKVIINYLHSESSAIETLNEVKKFSGGIMIKCDVTNEDQVKNMIDEIMRNYSKLDILINNAGIYTDGDEWNGTYEIWEKTLKHNLLSVMIMSKYASEVFLKQENGVIINIASRLALSGSFDELAYGAAKAGVINITQAYAKLLSPFGRSNVVSPGATNSGYWLRAPKDELEAIISTNPLGRLIDPNEIANTVLFLATDESKMITGQNILVNGGKN